MPELRKDLILGNWVIVAPERFSRPDGQAVRQSPEDSGGVCPFCRGNEAQTPAALLTVNRIPRCELKAFRGSHRWTSLAIPRFFRSRQPSAFMKW
jgi:galactose-1-phosphate uridylyltransferase